MPSVLIGLVADYLDGCRRLDAGMARIKVAADAGNIAEYQRLVKWFVELDRKVDRLWREIQVIDPGHTFSVKEKEAPGIQYGSLYKPS